MLDRAEKRIAELEEQRDKLQQQLATLEEWRSRVREAVGDSGFCCCGECDSEEDE